MRSGTLSLALAFVLVGFLHPVPASPEGCRPCYFWGGCIRDGARVLDCTPSEVGCLVKKGISHLHFHSTLPNESYWSLRATKRSRVPGRVTGKMKVHSDKSEAPSVPGFPARRCDRTLCFGRNARFVGQLTGDRLHGTARYRDGATCTFAMDLALGHGISQPNDFVCRDATDAVLSEGTLRVQIVRFRGCRQ